MPNDISRHPHIIDTAGAPLIVAASIYLRRVRWVGATTAGHQAVIQDSNGRVVWESICPGANYVEAEQLHYFAVGGYKVPTLGSGKLYIAID